MKQFKIKTVGIIIVSRKTYVVDRDDVMTENLRRVDWRGECVTLADEVAEVGVKVHEFEKARDDRDLMHSREREGLLWNRGLHTARSLLQEYINNGLQGTVVYYILFIIYSSML